MLKQNIIILLSGPLMLLLPDVAIVGSFAAYMERPCAATGGQCLLADECPRALLSDESGLCPRQRSKGIECCYGVSIKEHRCSRRGGQCLPRASCSELVVDQIATDCLFANEVCCILV